MPSPPHRYVSCPAGVAGRPCLRIVRGLFAALSDPAGVTAQRPGALERVYLALRDWHDTRARLADTEARMTGVLDKLGLAGLAIVRFTRREPGGFGVVGAAPCRAASGLGCPSRW